MSTILSCMMKSCATRLLLTRDPQPNTLSSSDTQPSTSLLHEPGSPKAEDHSDLLSEVNSSPTLCQLPHFFSSHGHFIISYHHKKDENITLWYIERETIFTVFLLQYIVIIFYLNIVNLLQCLIYNLNFIIGMYV